MRQRRAPGFKYQHDLVSDVLFDIFRCAGISAKKEAPVNFLTDPLEGRSTLRPADILVFGWVRGKHACVDLIGVSPLVGLGSSAFTVGQTALKAASGKVIKHEKACLDNQHVFIPFAFDTFGFLASEAVDLLSRVQRVMHSNVMTPRSMDVVFKRLSFAIQKGVAAQLVAHLPTIAM
ncbi:putative exostosin [Helianthus anomalus]